MSANRLTNFGKRIIHIYQKVVLFGLDLLFPRYCLGCGQMGIRLCQDCLDTLPRSWSSDNEKVIAVFDYNYPTTKKVLWALKYKRALDLAEILARPMYETLLEELTDQLMSPETKIILVPAPLSAKRLRFRGYNQAEKLAEALVKLNPSLFQLRTDLVKKTKDTPTQVSIKTRTERLENLKGAFELGQLPPTPLWAASQGSSGSSRLSSGTIFLILDDISTTGATINEITKVLKPLGIRKIYGLVVAHG